MLKTLVGCVTLISYVLSEVSWLSCTRSFQPWWWKWFFKNCQSLPLLTCHFNCLSCNCTWNITTVPSWCLLLVVPQRTPLGICTFGAWTIHPSGNVTPRWLSHIWSSDMELWAQGLNRHTFCLQMRSSHPSDEKENDWFILCYPLYLSNDS